MERLRTVVESAIRLQSANIGAAAAVEQARRVGLDVSDEGRILDWGADPTVSIIRLARVMAQDGNLAAVDTCLPLLKELEDLMTCPQKDDLT